jgi:hypothetical protein
VWVVRYGDARLSAITEVDVVVSLAPDASGRCRSGVGSRCAAFLTTELLAHVEGIPDADRAAAPGTWGSWLVGEMTLIRYTDLVTSPVQEHDAAMRQSLETRLTMLGERLRAANK